MTDTPSTPSNELELIRRLADLAETTTVDEGAWDAIQRRLTSTASPWARRSPWRLAAMAAAAVVLVVGALAMTRHDEDGGQVDIQEEEDKDRRPTTTVDDGDDEEESTPTTDPDGTTTTVAPGVASQDGEQPPGESTSDPGSEGTGGGSRGSGGAGSGSGTGSGGGGGSGTTVPPTTAPPTTMEDGRAPAVSVEVAGNTVLITQWVDRGTIWMNVWSGPDEWLTNSSWTDNPGQNCLAGEGMAFTFPGAGTFTFDWGFVRDDAAEVRIVMQDGSFATATIGAEHVPGVRAWLGVRPAGTFDHYEVRDSAGALLHDAYPPYANSFPDTC